MPNLSDPHISTGLDNRLSDFRRNALMMAGLAERSFDRARKGFEGRDEDWCNTVIADDEELDSLEVSLDHEAMAFLVRFHPVAGDLRQVIASMKFGGNLERVADQAVNIARRTRKLITREPVAAAARLLPAFDMAQAMLRDAVAAYSDWDAELARSLKERDRGLDRLVRLAGEELTSLMAEDTPNIPGYLDLVFIGRAVERIGDLAKSIGEDIFFAILAEDLRHTG